MLKGGVLNHQKMAQILLSLHLEIATWVRHSSEVHTAPLALQEKPEPFLNEPESVGIDLVRRTLYPRGASSGGAFGLPPRLAS